MLWHKNPLASVPHLPRDDV